MRFIIRRSRIGKKPGWYWPGGFRSGMITLDLPCFDFRTSLTIPRRRILEIYVGMGCFKFKVHGPEGSQWGWCYFCIFQAPRFAYASRVPVNCKHWLNKLEYQQPIIGLFKNLNMHIFIYIVGFSTNNFICYRTITRKQSLIDHLKVQTHALCTYININVFLL